jgi:hypothetical protein
MRTVQKIGATIGGVCLAVGLVFTVTYLANHYLSQQDHEQATALICKTTRTHHQIVIKDGLVSPQFTYAHLCDVLTITNKDDASRLMAFGQHDHHQKYGSIVEKMLIKNQQFTVQLTQPGKYIFHDHLDEQVEGSFDVSQ